MQYLYCIIFLIYNPILFSIAENSNLRKCADPLCKIKISEGRTTQRYFPKEKGVLACKNDEKVSIYSKEAGTNQHLWGVEINGRRGYLPYKFIKEEKVFWKNLEHIVPFGASSSEMNPSDNLEVAQDSKMDGASSVSSEKESSVHVQDSKMDGASSVSSQKESSVHVQDSKMDGASPVSSEKESVHVQDSKIDNSSPVTLEKELAHEEVAAEPIMLSLEDLEFNSIKNSMVKESSPSVPQSEEEKGNKEEIKITVTKSSAPNTIQENMLKDGEGQIIESIPAEEGKLRVGEQKIDYINTGENIQNVNPQGNIINNNSEGEKINLEIKSDKPKNEEVDNDEGNGNEGEDNGSEYITDDSAQQGENFKMGEKISAVNEVNLAASEESPNDAEQSERAMEPKNIETQASVSNGKSVKISSDDSTFIKHDTATPGLDKKNLESINEAPKSKLELVQPTPPQYEIHDGTSILVEDNQSTPSSDAANSASNLEASQLNFSPTTDKIPPMPKLPGRILTEPPLLLKNKLNEAKVSDSQMNLNLLPDEPLDIIANTEKPEKLVTVVELGAVGETGVGHDSSSSISDELQNVNKKVDTEPITEKLLAEKNTNIQSTQGEEYSEFSSPKSDSIIENQSQTHDAENEKSSIESTDSSENESSSLENQVNNNNVSPENINEITESNENSFANTESPDNQIVNTEAPESSFKFIDIPDGDDESVTPPTESGGLFASLSNTLNFLKGNSDSDTEKTDHMEQLSKAEDTQEDPTNPEGSKDTAEAKEDQTNQEDSEARDMEQLSLIEDKEDLANQDESKDIAENMENQTNQEKSEDTKDQIIAPKESDEDPNSSSLFENLPFIDPDKQKSKNVKEEVDESKQIESEEHIHTDEDQETNIQSFKKKLLHASESVMNEGMVLALEGELADPHLSTGTVIFLLVVAGTIVILYLSHMIMVKMSRESPLLEMMNKLDRSQRVLTEENSNLKRRLTDTNGQIKSFKHVDPAALQKLKHQFEINEKTLTEEIEELREKNQQLENDLEASTANEVELHRMLDELLSNQRETTNFEDSVNGLQLMLDGQREIVEGLTSDLALKTRLNEELRNELKDNKARMSKLEYQIEQLSQSLEEVNSTKHELMKKFTEEERTALALKEMNDTLRQEVDKVSKDSQNYYKDSQKLLQEVRKLKQKVQNKEAECQISKACLKKLQILTDGGGNDVHGKLAEIFKIIEVKTQLEAVQNERDFLKGKMTEEEQVITTQTENLKKIQGENSRLRESSGVLQKERDDAVSKLDVLSKYYEEREAQLRKTLESQEGLLLSAEGSASVVSNRIHTYEMELESCRSQVESLKTELEDQKQSYKVQLANEETKLHETWLTARAAERRQEELRQENTQLRQALTHMQRDTEHKNMFNKSTPKRVDANGSLSSPIPMENDVIPMHPGLPPLDLDGGLPLPPPPMMFPGRPPLPPPGLPPLPPHMFGPMPPQPPMPDRRLPPAGRIASPPGYDRRSYSPESDRSRYSDHRYSPGPPRYSPNNHRGHSPDRRSEHIRRNVNMRRNQRSPSPNLRRGQRSPSPLDPRQRHSPREQWYNHSPQGPSKNHRSPPLDYYDSVHENSRTSSGKGKKTSTPLGPNDR